MRTLRHLALALLLSTAAIIAVPNTADATIVVRLELADLVEQAEVIAVGTVVRMESRWTDDNRVIVTDIDIEVEDALLGCKTREVVSFTILGGSVDNLAQAVSGEAVFRNQERALVFLANRGSGSLGVIGLAQGKFDIETIPGSDIQVAAPSLDDITLADVETIAGDDGEPSRVVRAIEVPASVEPQPLEQLLEDVRVLIKTQR